MKSSHYNNSNNSYLSSNWFLRDLEFHQSRIFLNVGINQVGRFNRKISIPSNKMSIDHGFIEIFSDDYIYYTDHSHNGTLLSRGDVFHKIHSHSFRLEERDILLFHGKFYQLLKMSSFIIIDESESDSESELESDSDYDSQSRSNSDSELKTQSNQNSNLITQTQTQANAIQPNLNTLSVMKKQLLNSMITFFLQSNEFADIFTNAMYNSVMQIQPYQNPDSSSQI